MEEKRGTPRTGTGGGVAGAGAGGIGLDGVGEVRCFTCVHYLPPCAASSASTCESVTPPGNDGAGACRVQLNWLDPDYEFDPRTCKYYSRHGWTSLGRMSPDLPRKTTSARWSK
ncbi:MAG: hypothetical protein ACTSU5_21200 [Promethearchaeota archaeon]